MPKVIATNGKARLLQLTESRQIASFSLLDATIVVAILMGALSKHKYENDITSVQLQVQIFTFKNIRTRVN